jgi:hypothetical protein
MEYDNEELDEYLLEGENTPTNPELWSRAKAAARSKFDKYPSAYANLFASKWYKKHGGGWKKKKKKTNESTDFKMALKEIIMEILMEKKHKAKGELGKWLEQNWVRVGSSGKVAGECGSSKDTSNPDRCLPASKAHSLSREERAATAKKKKHKSQGGRKQFVPNTKKAKVKTKQEGYLEEDTDDTLHE